MGCSLAGCRSIDAYAWRATQLSMSGDHVRAVHAASSRSQSSKVGARPSGRPAWHVGRRRRRRIVQAGSPSPRYVCTDVIYVCQLQKACMPAYINMALDWVVIGIRTALCYGCEYTTKTKAPFVSDYNLSILYNPT